MKVEVVASWCGHTLALYADLQTLSRRKIMIILLQKVRRLKPI